MGFDLTFNMVEMRLYGCIEYLGTKHYFDSKYVGSGGRAGSTEKRAVIPSLANNPYAIHVKGAEDAKGRITKVGGPIPMGAYTLKASAKKNRIDLIPDDPKLDRDNLQIHGRGQKGSIGCIVPTDFDDVIRLYTLVVAIESAGLPPPRLSVIAQGDLSRFEQMIA